MLRANGVRDVWSECVAMFVTKCSALIIFTIKPAHSHLFVLLSTYVGSSEQTFTLRSSLILLFFLFNLLSHISPQSFSLLLSSIGDRWGSAHSHQFSYRSQISAKAENTITVTLILRTRPVINEVTEIQDETKIKNQMFDFFLSADVQTETDHWRDWNRLMFTFSQVKGNKYSLMLRLISTFFICRKILEWSHRFCHYKNTKRSSVHIVHRHLTCAC